MESGHVYRVLRGLERDRSLVSGWETAEAGPARRCYQLTAKGRDDLPCIVKEVHVTIYHILWELVHVLFEQPGLLEPELVR